jgi:hypothetical protein
MYPFLLTGLKGNRLSRIVTVPPLHLIVVLLEPSKLNSQTLLRTLTPVPRRTRGQQLVCASAGSLIKTISPHCIGPESADEQDRVLIDGYDPKYLRQPT